MALPSMSLLLQPIHVDWMDSNTLPICYLYSFNRYIRTWEAPSESPVIPVIASWTNDIDVGCPHPEGVRGQLSVRSLEICVRLSIRCLCVTWNEVCWLGDVKAWFGELLPGIWRFNIDQIWIRYHASVYCWLHVKMMRQSEVCLLYGVSFC